MWVSEIRERNAYHILKIKGLKWKWWYWKICILKLHSYCFFNEKVDLRNTNWFLFIILHTQQLLPHLFTYMLPNQLTLECTQNSKESMVQVERICTVFSFQQTIICMKSPSEGLINVKGAPPSYSSGPRSGISKQTDKLPPHRLCLIKPQVSAQREHSRFSATKGAKSHNMA